MFLLAHRGDHRRCIENSFTAFSSALKNGFDGVELDLRLTCDNEIVIFHDKCTRRLAKKNILIENSQFNQLEKIVLCKRRNFLSKQREKILTVEQFFHFFYNKFSIINLEIKTVNNVHILGNKLLSIATRYDDFYKKIIISSFSLDVLVSFRLLCESFRLGYLSSRLKSFKHNLSLLQNICQFLCVPAKVFLKNTTFFNNLNFPIIV